MFKKIVNKVVVPTCFIFGWVFSVVELMILTVNETWLALIPMFFVILGAVLFTQWISGDLK